jgi:hypothetical protein
MSRVDYFLMMLLGVVCGFLLWLTHTRAHLAMSACLAANQWAEDWNIHNPYIECSTTGINLEYATCILEGSNFEGSLVIECSATECRERLTR